MKSGDPSHPGFVKNLRCYFQEYCQSTSLHGLKFLGEPRRTAVEKVWWLTILTISLYFCAGFIKSTYHKWEQSPVIVNFATSQTPIWQIPFPAVTICPEIKTTGSKFNFSEMYTKHKYGNLTGVEKDYYEYMSLICANKNKLDAKIVDERMLDFIAETAPTIETSLWMCKWMGDYEKCSNLFVPVMTEAGVCFSFNILDHTEMYMDDVYQYKNFQSTNKTSGWQPQSGYSEDDEVDAYPQRALFAGAKAGLSLTLKSAKNDVDHLCSTGLQGYKVHFHHPADIPTVGQSHIRVPLDQAVIVAVKPRMLTTNQKLISYSSEQRKCNFAHEKALRFFKMYSQENCEIECLTNFTFKTCGCVPFYMPHVNSTPICGPAQERCILYAEAKFLTTQVSIKIKEIVEDTDDNDLHVKDTCDCLPSCFSTSYDVEITQTPWDWKRYYSEEPSLQYDPEKTYNSKLAVFFKERQTMTSERNELFGRTDFIANCGGLLGLFIGFSFISLTELIYFLTLRFAINLRKFGRYYWSGNSELLSEKQKN